MPTIDSENESIVATNDIFIRGGELEKVMGRFHENGVSPGAAVARRLHTTGDGTPSSRPPAFSSAVVSLKSSWGTFMKMQDLVATVTALSAVTVGLLTLRKAHD